MHDLSVLIGGKAGDGINQAGALLARLMGELGLRVCMEFDYPSLIRGGHNFSVVRASESPVAAHKDRIDFVLALNQDAVDLHRARLRVPSQIVFDSDSAESDGLGLPLGAILKELEAPPITRNSCVIGAFGKSIGIPWEIVERVLRKSVPREIELNLKLARRGFDAAKESVKLEPVNQAVLPIVTGNEAIGLGLLSAGLATYIAYPMTPTSNLLHFLAGVAKDFPLKVIHPENEIAVMLMALGASYAGDRVAVGTSGGGFCLMTEGFSLAGMAELPVVVVLGQRPGPSTGLPTYTSQTELLFATNAGQGEFLRFVVAPGDVGEAYLWSQIALNLSWKYQTPTIILGDKTLCEGAYSFDVESAMGAGGVVAGSAGGAAEDAKPGGGDVMGSESGAALRAGGVEIGEGTFSHWDGKPPYRRYADDPTGVSPLAFPSEKGAVVKVNSYEHDEFGITTEDPALTNTIQEK
ncbi:MAG: 2-oxoacid:acceptor oxidoreductase family protein, partial [Candidatus Eisenbacteria bacterium]